MSGYKGKSRVSLLGQYTSGAMIAKTPKLNTSLAHNGSSNCLYNFKNRTMTLNLLGDDTGKSETKQSYLNQTLKHSYSKN